MGLGSLKSACFQRKFRWILQIDDISGVSTGTEITVLPPIKSARPSLSFKEMEVIGLNENIFYPVRPEWKPIPLTLIDLVKNKNPIFDWISIIYDASANSTFNPVLNGPKGNFKKQANLFMLDGCGNTVEQWVYDNAYPQNIEWGELDMGESAIVTADLTLRYDRAYTLNS